MRCAQSCLFICIASRLNRNHIKCYFLYCLPKHRSHSHHRTRSTHQPHHRHTPHRIHHPPPPHPRRTSIQQPHHAPRIKLFTRLLRDKKIDFSLDDGAVLLAELTEGQSLDSRDIENSVQAAQQKALLRAVRNGGPEHYSMSLDDFDLLQSKLFQLLGPR
jgi:hypothetical protein